MVHSISGCTRGVLGKLWDPLIMHAHLRGVITTTCCTNQRLPLPLSFSVFECHAELTECEQIYWEDWDWEWALQIWTHWTVWSCWKITINVCHSLRRLVSWKSRCRPSGKTCHKNTSTRRWRTSPSAWLPTWLWLPMVVIPSICSNFICLQVCIIISSPINWLFSEPPTDHWWR